MEAIKKLVREKEKVIQEYGNEISRLRKQLEEERGKGNVSNNNRTEIQQKTPETQLSSEQQQQIIANLGKQLEEEQVKSMLYKTNWELAEQNIKNVKKELHTENELVYKLRTQVETAGRQVIDHLCSLENVQEEKTSLEQKFEEVKQSNSDMQRQVDEFRDAIAKLKVELEAEVGKNKHCETVAVKIDKKEMKLCEAEIIIKDQRKVIEEGSTDKTRLEQILQLNIELDHKVVSLEGELGDMQVENKRLEQCLKLEQQNGNNEQLKFQKLSDSVLKVRQEFAQFIEEMRTDSNSSDSCHQNDDSIPHNILESLTTHVKNKFSLWEEQQKSLESKLTNAHMAVKCIMWKKLHPNKPSTISPQPVGPLPAVNLCAMVPSSSVSKAKAKPVKNSSYRDSLSSGSMISVSKSSVQESCAVKSASVAAPTSSTSTTATTTAGNNAYIGTEKDVARKNGEQFVSTEPTTTLVSSIQTTEEQNTPVATSPHSVLKISLRKTSQDKNASSYWNIVSPGVEHDNPMNNMESLDLENKERNANIPVSQEDCQPPPDITISNHVTSSSIQGNNIQDLNLPVAGQNDKVLQDPWFNETTELGIMSRHHGNTSSSTSTTLQTPILIPPARIKIEPGSEQDQNSSVAMRKHRQDLSKRHLGYYCICGHKSKSKQYLQMHIRRYSLVNRFSCPYCPRKFKSTDALSNHTLSQHNMEYKLKGCQKCGTLFQTIEELKGHVKSQHPRKKRKFEQIDLTGQNGVDDPGRSLKTRKLSQNAQSNVRIRGTSANTDKSKSNRLTGSKSQRKNERAGNIPPTPTINISLDSHTAQKGISTPGSSSQQQTPPTLTNFDDDAINDDFVKSEPNLLIGDHGVIDALTPCAFFCLCKKDFPDEKALARHVKYYSGKYKFICKACQNGFYGVPQLKHHLLRDHGIAYKVSKKCNACENTFMTNAELKHHFQMVHKLGSS